MGACRCWIIIPARSFSQGKTRLAPEVDPPARRAFSRACLRHVIRVARRAADPASTLVVSRAGDVLGFARRMGAAAVRERRRGLNAAVAQAVDHALSRGAVAVLIVHADLPRLAAAELRRMLQLVSRRRGAVIAPDETRQGTNALGLRPPGGFRFGFGKESFERHCAEARRRHLRVHVVASPGLAFDVDTPSQHREFERAVRARKPGANRAPVTSRPE